MYIYPIQQNSNDVNFQALKFKSVGAKRKFMNILKSSPLDEFNESLNIIKAQDENKCNILIKRQTVFKDRLCAKIADEVVDLTGSLTSFLKKCAQKADDVRLNAYKKLMESGSCTEEQVKRELYSNSVKSLKGTDLPEQLI